MELFCYVIDIGTNSARMMLCGREAGRICRVYKTLRTVRTGEGFSGGRISAEACGRVRNALSDFARISTAEHPELPVYCFATSAMRDAENAGELLEAIKNGTGISVDVISGEEEARIGFAGAAGKRKAGIIDVGGGSTEIVAGENGVISFARSFPAGAVRAKNSFSELSAGDGARAAYDYARSLFDELPALDADVFYALGGSATNLAAIYLELAEYDPVRVQNAVLHTDEAATILKKLCSLELEERKRVTGLQPERADIIIYGIATLLAAADALNITSLTVSEADNLEGYAMKMAESRL